MYVFVWDYIGDLTERYHSGGGLVVVARSHRHAQELIDEKKVFEDDGDWYMGSVHRKLTLDFSKCDVYKTGASKKPRVYVFPDAGCC